MRAACRKFVSYLYVYLWFVIKSSKRVSADVGLLRQCLVQLNSFCLRLIAYSNFLQHRAVYCLRQHAGFLFIDGFEVIYILFESYGARLPTRNVDLYLQRRAVLAKCRF